MLYDVRTYVCHPGRVKPHLALYAEQGYEVQRRHLGDPVLYLVTETGNMNEIMHVWAYRDATDRAERRARLQADPAWAAYLLKSAEAGFLLSQTTRLMNDASFITARPA